MTEAYWPENFNIEDIWRTVDAPLGIAFNSISGDTYWIEYTDDLNSRNSAWSPFMNNGLLNTLGNSGSFTVNSTTATSGGEPTDNRRFYRIRR